ncbi:MAG: transglycosylase SLT domain-containing protein [Pseudomonadales bacterium]
MALKVASLVGRGSWALARRAFGSALLVVGLVACASSGRRGDVDEAQVSSIDERLSAVTERFRAGRELWLEGEVAEAREIWRLAKSELADVADECLSTPGCDLSRVLSTYDELLGERSGQELGPGSLLADGDRGDSRPSSLVTDVPEAGRSVNLLNGEELSKIISVNGPVRAAMHDWLTWMRPQLMDAYENYQVMRHLMWPAYEQAGLPEALLFGILAKESGGRVHAVSSAGAAGPFQFMYHTGRRFGLGQIDGFDTRYDPAQAAQANVAYLQEQFRVLNNNLELVLAAYNGGEGRMRRLYDRSRSKSFWSADIMGRLPRETQEYVPYVLSAAWIFLHPEETGVEFPAVDATPGTVVLRAPMTLSEIAICVGQTGSRNGWFRSLRNLNPKLDPNAKLPTGSKVEMPIQVTAAFGSRCVDGPMLDLAASLQSARQPGGVVNSGGRHYIVRRGDTLDGISRRFRCSGANSLARANNIAPPRYLIRPQQELRLVGCSG